MIARRGRDAGIGALLAVVLLVALAPAWDRPESQFDEGFALAYAVRVLDGDVPHRDFVSFYGPGNPWLVAGAFAIGGTDQETERVLGALYRLLIVLAAAGLAGAAAGPWAAAAAGLALVPLLLRIGFPAYAAFGSLGFALLALALMAAARAGPARLAAAGLAAGVAMLIRPETVLVVALAALPLVLGRARRDALLVLVGFAPAAAALAVHLLVVGPGRLGRVVEDLRASGDGRRLPFDPFSEVVATAEASRLLVLVVVLGALTLLASRRPPRPRVAAGLAILGLALIPYALSRLDYVHVVVPLIPALAGAVAVASHRPWVPLAVASAAVLAVLALAPRAVWDEVRLHGNRLLGRVPAPALADVEVEGRSFRLDAEGARAVQTIVDAAERERRDGARTLFVGPGDLRRSNLNDAFVYYLLADLEPASYYMEMNPWTANRPGSGLADELRRTDLIVRNTAWDAWNEPNASDRLGPAEPNQAVRERFCSVAQAGTYELLRRCR